MSSSTIYLVYGENGRLLLYSGQDEAEYERHCREQADRHGGSVFGRRSVGPRETWVVRAYFDQQPADSFVAQRRGNFRFDLRWEPSVPASA